MEGLPMRVLLGAGLILLVTVAAYIPAMRSGFVWDDDMYVTENSTLKTFDGLFRIWFKLQATPQYYPLVFSTFWLEYHLWELEPLGYHLSNILLHAVAAVVLWLVLRRLAVPGGYLAAVIFSLHPVHVESVAWITERKNVLSGLFYLSALLAYLRFRHPDEDRPTGPNRRRFYALALVLFVCALLSKTVTCSLPAVILLLFWWKRDRLRFQEVVPLVPMFMIGLAMGLTTAWVEKHHVGAEGQEWTLSLVERCLIAGRALWFYAGKLLWPVRLTFIYPRWEIDSGLWRQYLHPAAAAAVMVSLWLLRRRIGKAPLAAVLIFAGTLLPALGFIDVFPMRYSFVADHFQYLASIALITPFAGLLTVLAVMLSRFLQGAEAPAGKLGRARILQFLPAAVVVSVLGALTWNQAKVYQDLETLWRDTLAKNPAAWMAHNNLGRVLEKQENLKEAAKHYSEALRLKQHYLPHYNLGSMFAKQGRHQEAVYHLKTALEMKPELPGAHCDLARIMAMQDRLSEAAYHLFEALRLRPDHADTHHNLGNVLAKQGDLKAAVDHLSEAARIKPDDADTHYDLGNVLKAQGKSKQAAASYRRALRLSPGLTAATNNLAWMLATHPDPELRDGLEAVRLAERACQPGGDRHPTLLDTLAAAYAEAGRLDEAVETAQKALIRATETNRHELAGEIRGRLKVYESGLPYREVPPAGSK